MAIEAVALNEWYPVAIVDDVSVGREYTTRLLGTGVSYVRSAEDRLTAWNPASKGDTFEATMRYRTCWVSLGSPTREFFEFPEFHEPDRKIVGGGSMMVHTSGLRAVENFLDMAHFPYVHDGFLGGEPYTDVAPYDVKVEQNGEIYARNCRFFQPHGGPNTHGYEVDYVYRVVRPYSAFLYKTDPGHPDRSDVIGLFVQPVAEDWCVAHTLLAPVDTGISESDIRTFQQTVFGQDLMLLSNEVPRTLPIDTQFEMPIRADAMSVAYRRWLKQMGLKYGTYQPVVA